MLSNRLLIKGAFTVTEEDETCADIYIAAGKVVCVAPLSSNDLGGQSPTPGFENPHEYVTIDGKGLVALPGGVDPHTHFDLDAGLARSSDDFYSGTVAAACGGTTTIIDHMAFGKRGSLPTQQLEVYHGLAGEKSVIDYGFHGVVQAADNAVLENLAVLKSLGVSSLKGYLTYDYRLSDSDLLKIMERTGALGMVFCLHAENHDIISLLRARYAADGFVSPSCHPESRPAPCEAEAIYRSAQISILAGNAPLYIVHLSSAAGLAAFNAAKERGVRHLMAETCPQYLFLTDALYTQPDDEGLKYVMSPPLRKERDRELLWKGLNTGMISTIGTDHCPFYFSEKRRISGGDFTRCPNGIPGVEARMALLFDQASRGKVTLRQITDWCCRNPARIFGLYPRKGVIKSGSDGDIVLFDPQKEVTLTRSLLHENCDYTPYEGIRLRGFPVMTFSRGELIVKEGLFLGKKGRGRFLAR